MNNETKLTKVIDKISFVFTKPISNKEYENYKVASWYKRFLSFFIDTIFIVPIYLLFVKAIIYFNITNLDELFIQSSFSLIFFVYLFICWLSLKGQTIGQRLLSTKIVSDNNKDLSLIEFIGRFIGYVASNILLGIGFLTIFVRKDNKCLHDMTSNAKVVDLKKSIK